MLSFRSLLRRISRRDWTTPGVGLFTLDALGSIWAQGIGSVLLVGMILTVASSIGSASARRDAWNSLDTFEQRVSTEASAANAIFLPNQTVTGQVNCSGGQCSEIDFFEDDSQHVGHYWAYLFTGSGIQRYVYTGIDSSGTPQNVATVGSAIPATSFFVRDVPVTNLPSDSDASPLTQAWLAAHPEIQLSRWTYQYEAPGVVASNDVFYFHVAKVVDPWNVSTSSYATQSDVYPVTLQVVPRVGTVLQVGWNAPTAPPTIGPSTTDLVFFYPTAANQSITAHEYQYHNYFTAGTPCLMSGTQVATSASAVQEYPNPNPSPPPLGQDSGPATWSIAPNNAGLCNFPINDVYGQNVAATVQVMGPLQVVPNSMLFVNALSPAQSGSGSKTYDNAPIGLTFSGCNGIVSVSQGTQSTPGSISASSAQTGIVVTPIGYSGVSCTVTVTDQYGETGTIAINYDPTPPPTATPAPSPTPTLSPEYMWGTQISNPDTETVTWYTCYTYQVPGDIWFGCGSNAPEIGMAVGQTLYIDAACPPGSFSGSDSDYANDVQVGLWYDPWNEDPSGYQCMFTPTGPGWFAIGYWDGPGSPAGQLEFVQVGGYGGPYNNNILNTPPPQGSSPGGG